MYVCSIYTYAAIFSYVEQHGLYIIHAPFSAQRHVFTDPYNIQSLMLTIRNPHSTLVPRVSMSHDGCGLFSQQHGDPIVLEVERGGIRRHRRGGEEVVE